MPESTPIPPPYGRRIERLRKELEARSLSGLLVTSPENRRYLSGFRPKDPQINESSGFLIIGRGVLIIGTDPRYEEEAKRQARGFYPFIYYKGLEASWGEIRDPVRSLNRLAFESQAVSYHLYLRLKKLLHSSKSPVSLVPTRDLVEELRSQKDPSEIQSIRRSLKITEEAFQEISEGLKPGQTEKEIAWLIKERIVRKGGEDVAFEPIVASGPNAALPHAEATERRIREGEPIIFDLGGRWKGYCSDLSRTLCLGRANDRFKEVYRLVRQAQEKAQKEIRAGMSALQGDFLARSVIEKAGYGPYFKHSLGHGVGLATHELPSLSPLKDSLLKEGMVITVEPGIYLPAWGGVRLENMIVLNKNRSRILNRDQTFYRF